MWADGTITGVHTEKVTYRTDSLEKMHPADSVLNVTQIILNFLLFSSPVMPHEILQFPTFILLYILL